MRKALVLAAVFTCLALAARTLASVVAGPATSDRIGIIVDTDAGTDDLIALALLSADPNVDLEAVTVVDGLSSVPAGVTNIRRLLSFLGKSGVPVIAGATRRLQETKRFPSDWRKTTESAPAGLLPAVTASTNQLQADEYLAGAIARGGSSTRILALGPLTNVALALRRLDSSRVRRVPLTIMGGAFASKGNLISFNDSTGLNSYAEWNVFSDPLAAEIVLRSPLDITLVPLDVTGTVRFKQCVVDSLRREKRNASGDFVLGTLDQVKDWIDRGDYYAWDPLAAAIAADGIKFSTRKESVGVTRNDQRRMGQTTTQRSGNTVSVVDHVSPSAFFDWFLKRSARGGVSGSAGACVADH